MGRPAIRRSYIPWSLLVGVVLGFGTNLVTANPAQWWGPLQPVSQYAPVWFPASVVAVLGWGVFRSWHALRRVRWRRSDSPYAGLAAFTSDRASVFFGRDEETRGLGDWCQTGSAGSGTADTARPG
jgi:MFS superfamily sulfate permease-like transporter